VATVGGSPRLSGLEWVCLVVLSTMLLGVGGLGAFVSFSNVRAAMAPAFGSLAWAVPVGVDVGIFLFTGWDLLLSRLDMRPRVLRFVPWSLIAATIYLNVEPSLAAGDVPGAVGHAVLPGIWVISVEITAGLVRHRAGLTRPADRRYRPERLDRIRTSRWLLAPLSTLWIVRLMILWEERSYQAALDRWMARRRARAQMAKKYGLVKWRWRAPIDLRLDYRYAQLSLTSPDRSEDLARGSASRGARSPGGGSSPARRQGAAPKPRSSPRRPSGRVAVAGRLPGGSDAERADEAMPAAREVAAELAAAGVPLNRETLRDGLRARDKGVGNSVLGELLARLRAEQTARVGASS
jgi:hypothetical protein